MRYLLCMTATTILHICMYAQDKKFSIHNINLPLEISYFDNQFSGLQIAHQKLYLMSESRLQDNREAKLYAIKLSDLDHYIKDTSYTLPFEKIKIYGLDSLAVNMKKDGQEYEGLEALVINGQSVYFSVETSTPSPYCYLLKGRFDNGNIYLQQKLMALQKPCKPNGNTIYNAGFEAMFLKKNKLHVFYEYNYFDNNYVYSYDTSLNANSKDSALIDKLPFRITDITAVNSNHFTAINYFYKGEGGDTVYRMPPADSINNKLIDKQGSYDNYCRLIDINYSNKYFSWRLLWVFPKEYTGYNWEGIAAHNHGYFIINDKYTLARPYASVLLYIQRNSVLSFNDESQESMHTANSY